jgi:hypothetical protein
MENVSRALFMLACWLSVASAWDCSHEHKGITRVFLIASTQSYVEQQLLASMKVCERKCLDAVVLCVWTAQTFKICHVSRRASSVELPMVRTGHCLCDEFNHA